jgi:hypothetical protein
VLTAVKQDGSSLIYASNLLKNDREVVLTAVQQYGMNLKFAPKHVKDREVVMSSVKSNGESLKFACKSIRNHRDIVLAAVKQSGHALKFASAALQEEPEMLVAAVSSCLRNKHSHHRIVGSVTMHGDEEQVKDKVLNYIEPILHNWHTFHDVFLSGWMMRIKVEEEGPTTPPSTTSLCKLPLLNKLGKYALIDLKKRIAAYAGVCYGESLLRAQQAKQYFISIMSC